MSHSVSSESSAIDATFLVGADLVEFDRRDLPIYLTPQAHAMAAGVDEPTYGAPVDRVFGEPGISHIDGTVPASDAEPVAAFVAEDPLVSLAAMSDGLLLPASESAAAPELATGYEYDTHSHPVVHLHDGIGWEISGSDGIFDFQI
ncbi:hypothetical protein BH11PSE3_BH11PSE3_38930 [soil metagenome]